MIASCIDDTGSTEDGIKYLTIIKAKFYLSSIFFFNRRHIYLQNEDWCHVGKNLAVPERNLPVGPTQMTELPGESVRLDEIRKKNPGLPRWNYPHGISRMEPRKIVYIWRGSVDILNSSIGGHCHMITLLRYHARDVNR